VENAIYHGIKNKDGSGLIRIAGRVQDATLAITVSDDGVGMSRERLASLRAELDCAEAPDLAAVEELGHGSGGVGLRNVQERIRLYAGGGYGLSFESEPGRGTTALIRLPALQELRP